MMDRTRAHCVWICIAAFSFSLPAQVGLTGRVLDENSSPVADADLFLSGAGLAVRSDDSGFFDFTNGQGARHRRHAASPFFLTLSGSTLRYRVPANGPVRIDVLTSGGRVVRTPISGHYPQGDYGIDLLGPGNRIGSGLYYAKIRMGEQTIARPFLSIAKGIRLSHEVFPTAVASGRRKRIASVDTLVVVKEGFQTASFVIDSVEGDLGALYVCGSSGYPRIVIAEGDLRVLVYVPDNEEGYYRGTRFDWAGMIGQVRHGGFTWYRDWKTPHSPENPEHAVGPADEFDIDNPPGYSSAAAGDNFVKIGVGVLEKSGDVTYSFNSTYPLSEPGIRTLARGTKWVEFTHDIPEVRGIGYSYTKMLRVIGDSSRIAVTRRLTNTGTDSLTTEQYCHNFTIVNNRTIGAGYRLTFGFPPSIAAASPSRYGSLLALDGTTIRLLSNVPAGSMWLNLGGLTNSVQDNFVRIENTTLGASVTIVGDLVPHKLNVWAVPEALCPEIFVSIPVLSGETKTWTTTYTFAGP